LTTIDARDGSGVDRPESFVLICSMLTAFDGVALAVESVRGVWADKVRPSDELRRITA
jgi:hypothetical protein